jgi:drug/metabolite transporter (DMT)-like permease
MYNKYLLTTSSNNQAIFYAILSSLWISIMLCAVRHVSAEYNSFAMVFWRSCFSLLFMLPWFLQKKSSILKTANIKLHLLRTIIGIISMTCWFYALGKLMLPQAISLSFTAPIFTAIAAVIFLKERLGKKRSIAIIIGFIGTLVIIRPGFTTLNYALFIVLFSTSLWAIVAVIIKKLTYDDNHKTILFYMSLFSVPLSLPLAIIFWQDINLYYLLWFAFIGFTANLSHICLTKAISLANLTVILPFDFIRLVFTSILAYIIFKDPTNIYDIIGATIIIGSNVYISYRENKVKDI